MTDAEHTKELLENKRLSEIKNLGILCYNRVADKQELPDALIASVNKVREVMQDVQTGAKPADAVDEAVIETGFICYNLYIDNSLYQDNLLTVCRSIDDLNNEIRSAASAQSFENVFNMDENNHASIPDVFYDQENEQENNVNENEFAGYSSPEYEITHSQFKVNQPYGMEPIPEDFIRCKCGYRNRQYANFCGKCGALLKRRDKRNVIR